MPKPRRKSEIRAIALREVAVLREAAEVRAAFLKPRARSWHDVFLAALKSGRSASVAAQEAGISKSGAYKARMAEPGFRGAWDAAIAAALAEKRQKRAAALRDHWRRRIAAPAFAAQRRDDTAQREIATLGRCEPGQRKVDGAGADCDPIDALVSVRVERSVEVHPERLPWQAVDGLGTNGATP